MHTHPNTFPTELQQYLEFIKLSSDLDKRVSPKVADSELCYQSMKEKRGKKRKPGFDLYFPSQQITFQERIWMCPEQQVIKIFLLNNVTRVHKLATIFLEKVICHILCHKSLPSTKAHH